MAREMPHVEGVRHDFVELPGLRMHVAEAGPEHADPVLLLHGWPQHWYEWRRVIGPLAERYRVICPDLRGLGWSDAPERDYRKETLADDVLALLDERGIERVRIAGHDWGGWIGFLLCLREPERVDSFLALNILPPFIRITPRALLSQWRFWYQWVLASPLGAPAMRAAADGMGERILRWLGSDALSEDDREIFRAQFREPERARASVLYYRDFQLREIPGILAGRYRSAKLSVPTLLLFGTGDKVLDHRLLEGADEGVQQLTVEFVPGVGHLIVDVRPDLVVERALSLFETE